MYVCMYVCMYVYIYVCKCVCLCVCSMLQILAMYACMYAGICDVCMYVLCMHVCIHVCMYSCMYVTIYVYVYLCSYDTTCLRNNQTFITEINKCTMPNTKQQQPHFPQKQLNDWLLICGKRRQRYAILRFCFFLIAHFGAFQSQNINT